MENMSNTNSKLQCAMIGLGKMGGNMAQRLAQGGCSVYAYDVDVNAANALAAKQQGVQAMPDLSSLAAAMTGARIFWLMVPHQFVDSSIEALGLAGLKAGDVIVDGGNSNYKKSQERAEILAKDGILFADCGTSGGIWGLQEGYSMMLGAGDETRSILSPIIEILAPSANKGWGFVGPVGAGHYVKMIHNGIEYGMMQAFAEGFDLLEAKEEMALDKQQIAEIWQHGSVVRSWLLDLIADAFGQDANLDALSDWMDDSGEGRWTVQESIDLAIPAPVIALALQMRFASRQKNSTAGKVINAMRAGFGGHPIRPAGNEEKTK
ncbi:MAG: decarboxylating 6-phosphogluconate dehydrogenase [Mariprofundales bacterium]